MNESLITTTTLEQELPVPVEFVLDNGDDNDSNESAAMRSQTTTSISSNNNNHHHDQQHHVRFDEHLEIHEIDGLTPQEHDLYWYKDEDYVAMQREAGFTMPSKRQKITRGLRTACWIERSLWLGTVVCGVLLTESFHHAHHAGSRRDR